jgi:hypothetical protein
MRVLRRFFLAAAILGCTLPLGAAEKSTQAQGNIDGVWLGVSLPGGGGAGANWPRDKFTPEAKKLIDEFNKTYGPDVPEAGNYCVHTGMPAMMTNFAGYPIEIMTSQNKKQMNMLQETGTFRRIFLDGRPLPTDVPPTATGFSVGRWADDVLVIETNSLAQRLDSRWVSEEARVTERLYLVDDKGDKRSGIAETMQVDRSGKMLVVEITLNDPKFYVEPVKFKSNFRRAPDTAVLEYDCGREFYEAALDAKIGKKAEE